MIFRQEIMDLFTVSDEYFFAHCISADFAMGKGIAVEFNKRYNMKNILQNKYLDYINQYHYKRMNGDCILEGRVLNLITKERYYEKPTYASITIALEKMRDICIKNNISKVAMPKIGCGLDRLKWDKVIGIIMNVFQYTNIEILVCIIGGKL